jgi:RNA polymerase II subunit A small phosphatase-like protein
MMDDLVNKGKIKYYGVSVETVDEAMEAIKYPNIKSVQIIFNIFRQKPAEVFFKEAAKKNIAIIVRVPLASGLLTGKMNSQSTFPLKSDCLEIGLFGGQSALSSEASGALSTALEKPTSSVRNGLDSTSGDKAGIDKLLTFNLEQSSRVARKESNTNGKPSSLSRFMSLMNCRCCTVDYDDDDEEELEFDNFHRPMPKSSKVYKKQKKDFSKNLRVFSRFPSTPNARKVSEYDSSSYMLPPQGPGDLGKKTLVLDLDETLVHSSFDYLPDADVKLPIEVQGLLQDVYVRKRPGLEEFLEYVGEHYEVGVFTASVLKYADAVLDEIDPSGIVQWRLFRESCCQTSEGFYVKDLDCLGRRLEDTIIIDNSPHSYLFHPENAIPIKSFVDDVRDNHLVELIPFLDHVKGVKDVRVVLKDVFS